MLGFTIAAAIGFLALCVAFFLDGVLDMFDLSFGSKLFSGASLGGLLCGFGFGGIVGRAQGWSIGGCLLFGLVCGLLTAVGSIALYRWMKKSGAETDLSKKIVGTRGRVTVGASRGHRGLVQVDQSDNPKSVAYVSDDDMQTGQWVVIKEKLGPDLWQVSSSDD